MTKNQTKMMMEYISERTVNKTPRFNLKALQQFFLRKNMNVSRYDMRDVLAPVLELDASGKNITTFKPNKFKKLISSFR